jgi:hypothetical protein
MSDPVLDKLDQLLRALTTTVPKWDLRSEIEDPGSPISAAALGLAVTIIETTYIPDPALQALADNPATPIGLRYHLQTIIRRNSRLGAVLSITPPAGTVVPRCCSEKVPVVVEVNRGEG